MAFRLLMMLPVEGMATKYLYHQCRYIFFIVVLRLQHVAVILASGAVRVFPQVGWNRSRRELLLGRDC